jgi:AraC family transcriptional regulator of arabinose operon
VDRRIRATLALLHDEWPRTIRVHDLARRVGLGASRLEHLFKAHAKMTIRDYVREQRLARAAEMLRSGNERVSVICVMVGFGDVSNFNHAFKKRFGLAPREYRDRSGNDEVSSFHQEKAQDTK